MPAAEPPDEVQRLVDERAEAREARDWARADALRERIGALGWEVGDAVDGSTARPLLPREPTATGYAEPADLATRLDEAATVAASLHVLAEDHPDDFRRLLVGLRSYPPSIAWELVVVANAPSFELDEVMAIGPPEAVLIRTTNRLGWADARTLGLRRSLGEMTVVLDTSVEPTGDFIGPLLAAFDDASVGIAGPWGVVSETGRQFEEGTPGEVDAIAAYCLAVRRDALRTVGGFERRFRYYRHADLDLSFAIRDAGWRAVQTEPLPLVRHEHRGWSAYPDAERDRLSRRNFYRFLDRWGDRPDLFVSRRR